MISLPLNRISQYRILLEKMMQYTPEDHKDFLPIVNSFCIMAQMYEHIQSNIEQAETQASLMNVLKRLDVADQPVKSTIIINYH